MWYTITNQTIQLYIKVKPQANKTQIIALDNDVMFVAIQARAKESEANKALIIYLAALFMIAKSTILITHGEKSRYKRISLPLTATTALRLQQLKTEFMILK
jgi:uncharacterized protein (TIGR00251 family)